MTCTCSPSILDPLCPVEGHRTLGRAGVTCTPQQADDACGLAGVEATARILAPAIMTAEQMREATRVVRAELGDDAGGDWCLVRYLDDKFCGPLSPITAHTSPRSGGLGFPGGKVGLVAWFSNSEEAAASSTDPRDKPTRAADLHFSAHDYNHHNRQERCFYDGGDYRLATVAVALRERQIALEEPAPGCFRVEVKCRLTARAALASVGHDTFDGQPFALDPAHPIEQLLRAAPLPDPEKR